MTKGETFSGTPRTLVGMLGRMSWKETTLYDSLTPHVDIECWKARGLQQSRALSGFKGPGASWSKEAGFESRGGNDRARLEGSVT